MRGNPLLIVLNPRKMQDCIDAIEALDIDQVWFRYYSERQLESIIPDWLEQYGQEYTHVGVISDDAKPTQHALDLVLDAYHHDAVYTGYCQVTDKDPRLNLSSEPLTSAIPQVAAYTFVVCDEMEQHPEPLFRSYFAGHTLTFMSLDLWRKYPWGCYGSGNGWASDYHLAWRLQADNIPVWAVKGAWVEHVKSDFNTTERDPERQIQVGKIKPEIDHKRKVEL